VVEEVAVTTRSFPIRIPVLVMGVVAEAVEVAEVVAAEPVAEAARIGVRHCNSAPVVTTSTSMMSTQARSVVK